MTSVFDTHPPMINVIISYVKEIRFWNQYPPTFYANVLKIYRFFVRASLSINLTIHFATILYLYKLANKRLLTKLAPVKSSQRIIHPLNKRTLKCSRKIPFPTLIYMHPFISAFSSDQRPVFLYRSIIEIRPSDWSITGHVMKCLLVIGQFRQHDLGQGHGMAVYFFARCFAFISDWQGNSGKLKLSISQSVVKHTGSKTFKSYTAK